MATVQITDIYEPKTFEQLIQEKSTAKNAFIKSNVIVQSPKLDAMASVGGRIGDMPTYNAITNSEPNYSSDDNTSDSTPENIGDTLQRWRLAAMNNSWSVMDLSRELALSDPVDAITDSIGGYWAVNNQTRLINSCLGILADNVADDSSDMLYSVATDAAGAVTDAERISAEVIILAAATMGDKQNEFTAIAMHSTIYAKLKLLNLIDYVEDSDAKTRFAMYQEMVVIVDDALPAVAGTNRITYTTILFKPMIFGEGNGNVENASELDRKPSSGDGGGETVIHSRMSKILHPWGFDFESGTVAKKSPSWAELKLAVNWDREYQRKNCGIAFIQTNG